DMSGIVLATGGGAVLRPENRQKLAARGTVVYLYASVDQQLQRTLRDKRRPLIQNKETRLPTLQALMEERDPLYREVSDFVVETDGRTVRSVANEVIKMLQQEDFLLS